MNQRKNLWAPFAWLTMPLSVRIKYGAERAQLVGALLRSGWTPAKANEAAGWRLNPLTKEREEMDKWEQGMFLANTRPAEYERDGQETYWDG